MMGMVDEFVEGTVLDGKYRIERVIGRGGMGVVVAARHLVLDERVAIKFLSQPAWINSEVVARFEREARAAVKIKSEHVVRVIDVGRLASGAPYMVMEYLDGEDLSVRLAARGPLPVEQAVDFVLHACIALAGAHAAGIVHRDIKPGNLFCTQGSDGQLLVKVLDFGISKLTEAAQRAEGGLSVTKTAAVLGSPLYMSPEQIKSSKDVDLRTDVWSLGVVLFELIAGQVPFPGESFGEVAIKIAMQPVPPLGQFRRDVPPGLDAVIGRCLEKERQQRYSNVGELARALGNYASARGRLALERISRLSQSGPISAGALGATEAVPLSAPARSAEVMQPASLSGSGREPGALPETASAWGDSGEHRSSRRAVLGTTALVVVGLAVIGAIVFRQRLMPGVEAGAGSVALPAPNSTPSTTALPTPVPVASVAPVVTASATVAPAPPETSAPSAEPELAPPAESSAPKHGLPARRQSRSPTPVAPAPRPTALATPAPAAPPAPSPRPPEPARPASPPEPANVTARPAAPKPDCDPPYVLDDQGRKRFKPECFK
jgi:serine/threonine-protein kinase